MSARPVASTRLAGGAVLAVLLSSGQTRGAAQGSPESGPQADLPVYGHADYDWTIRPLGGDPVELEAFRGNVLFINLWASWCLPCVREMETIERLGARLADTEVRFPIVAAEGERAVRRHLRRRPYDLSIYLEADRIPPAFGLRGLPTSWIVDRQGRIVVRRHGAAVWDTVWRDGSRRVATAPAPSLPTPGGLPGITQWYIIRVRIESNPPRIESPGRSEP